MIMSFPSHPPSHLLLLQLLETVHASSTTCFLQSPTACLIILGWSWCMCCRKFHFCPKMAFYYFFTQISTTAQNVTKKVPVIKANLICVTVWESCFVWLLHTCHFSKMFQKVFHQNDMEMCFFFFLFFFLNFFFFFKSNHVPWGYVICIIHTV